MLVGLTYSLSGVMGLTVLMGVYIGAIYGGSITAITINVPGTALPRQPAWTDIR